MGQTILTPQQREARRKWVVALSALQAVVASAIKLAFALYTGSAGLLADALHSMTDVAGSLAVWVGIRVSTHKYRAFPYGFYKIENLLAMAIGGSVLYGAYELTKGFSHDSGKLPTNVSAAIAVMVFLIAVNFFWGRFEIQTGKLLHSPGIEASGKHTMTDLYSSLAVLAGLVGAYWSINIDQWVSLAIVLVLIKVGLTILWDNLKVLLDISLPKEQLKIFKDICRGHSRGARSNLHRLSKGARCRQLSFC